MLCRCERRRSVFQMGSSFMCFNPPSWCLVACLRGLIFWNGKDTGETGSSISSEIQTRVYLRDYSLPEPQVSPSYHTEEYVLDPYFLSLCALFAMSSSKISLHPPSLFFLIVQFSVFSLSNFIMAWAVSQYSKHSRLFPLQWKIDYKSQVFLWSNPVLLETKSHFFKYSKMEKESNALLMIQFGLRSAFCTECSLLWLSFKAIVYSLHFLYHDFCFVPSFLLLFTVLVTLINPFSV